VRAPARSEKFSAPPPTAVWLNGFANTFGVLLGQAGIASGCSRKTINFSLDDGTVEGWFRSNKLVPETCLQTATGFERLLKAHWH